MKLRKTFLSKLTKKQLIELALRQDRNSDLKVIYAKGKTEKGIKKLRDAFNKI